MPKNCGTPNCPNPKGNPINAGTGDKFQSETIYSGPGPHPLSYVLAYTSRRDTNPWRPTYAHGKYWHANHERRLFPDATGTATSGPGQISARRPDGKLLAYDRQADGSYKPDADIADRLTRQSNATGGTLGWTLTAARGDEVETYDATGKLLSLANRAGLTQTYAYDGNGRLASISDPYGRSLSLAYDVQNRVSSLTQPDGLVVGFSYDAAGNLAGITWPDTRTRQFHYENATYPNNLTGISDENGARYATWTYDAQGRAISSEHAGGVDRVTLAYGANSTTSTDALGTVRSLGLTTILGVVRGTGEDQPGGSGCGAAASSLAYDANGNVASRADFNGNVTTYAYDLARNLETRRTEGAGSPAERTISTEWHAVFRLPARIAEPLKRTTYTYDIRGNLLSRSEQATSDADGSQGFAAPLTGSARTWTWTYDAAGQVLVADGPRTDVVDTTTHTYYPANDPDPGKRGLLATITNALGHVTRITAYDGNGRPLSITDANGLVTTLSYTPRGWLASRSVGSETTTYQRDGVGQLSKVTLPDGSFLAYTYDPAHRLTAITDNLGNRIAWTLDAAGNRTGEQVSDPDARIVRLHSRIYDALGRLQAIVQPQ